MCGICGILHDDPKGKVDRDALVAMNRTMIHRGPDDEGYHVEGNVGLGMRRLSIIDLLTGHQPMATEDGSVVAVCNGEIYNFQELKKDLEARGCTFKTNSDAEVIPYLYREFGDDFLDLMNGMFGLAVWDAREKRLIIARDRMGKKPLYWAHVDGVFLFGSELKAIIAHPRAPRTIDRTALAKYLAYHYIPAPRSIFENVHKLGPGEFLSIARGAVKVERYWDIPLDEHQHLHSEREVIEELRGLLRDAVGRRLISDVPLGVFLSGGIDSSTVVAMMSELRDPQSIKTFSIAFAEESFDESTYARQVAKHFRTDHYEEMLTPKGLLDLMPDVSDFLDEPMADYSIVPTYALSKFTRKHVTVALGGDGGDELFAGYPTFKADRYAKMYRMIPRAIRDYVIAPMANALPASDADISLDFKAKQFVKGAGMRDPSRHMIWMGAFSPEEQIELWDGPTPSLIFDDVERCWSASYGASPGNRILYLYAKLYLQEDILVKVDRASMATSLEVRAPFLDPEVVEFVSRLPYSYKLRGLTMKYLLKKAIGDKLPKGIAGRAKKGFGIPVAKWFKGELRELLMDELAEDKIRREGFFRPAMIARLIDEHLKGRANHRMKLWALLVFELWLKKWA